MGHSGEVPLSEPGTLEQLVDAVRATLELFLEDAPQMHGVEFTVEPIEDRATDLLITVEEEEFRLMIDTVDPRRSGR